MRSELARLPLPAALALYDIAVLVGRRPGEIAAEALRLWLDAPCVPSLLPRGEETEDVSLSLSEPLGVRFDNLCLRFRCGKTEAVRQAVLDFLAVNETLRQARETRFAKYTEPYRR